LPNPSRFYRRIAESSLPTRVIAHLSVVSLVILASAAGFSHSRGSDADAAHFTGSAPFVTTVRGAAVDAGPLETLYFDTRDAVGADELLPIDRGARAAVPSQSEPLATPVPIDPDATPLAAPSTASNVGSTTSSAGTTTRVAAPASAALVWPVVGGSISQYFHAGHLALDIAASYGNTVVAAQAGTVTSAGWRNNGGGNVISIDHGNGMITVYNHLGSIWVSPGQYVSASQGIGGVGCTGICTGPHVHFEVIVNGVIDNPLRYL
jgi:murein DD-endopeptidase MepM/ murein hydrolase activator NlpD